MRLVSFMLGVSHLGHTLLLLIRERSRRPLYCRGILAQRVSVQILSIGRD